MLLRRGFIASLFLLLFVAVSIFPQNSMAVFVPFLEPHELVSQSDVVCKGKAVRVDKIGELEEQLDEGTVVKINVMVAQIEVERILKGNGIGEIVEVEFQERPFLPYAFLQQDEYSILFLKKKGERYIFANPYHENGKMSVSRRKLDVVVRGTTPMALLEQELINSLRDEDPKIILSALEVLGRRLKSIDATQEIKNLLGSANVAVRGGALLALLDIGDYSHIDESVEYLDEIETTRKVGSYKRMISNAFHAIRDPSLVPKLHPLLRHEDDFLRKNVAESLRNIQSESSIPYLMDGLDDRNIRVRYQCMMGLAKMLKKGGDWAPAYEIFLKNESKHTSLWRGWWDREGREKFPKK